MIHIDLDPRGLRNALERWAKKNVVVKSDAKQVTVSARPIYLAAHEFAAHEFGTRSIMRRAFVTRGPH